MPINISNISTHAKNNASETSRANEQKHVKAEAEAGQSPKTTPAQDSVNLTDSAMRIKSLEAQIARLPIVDTQKVEQIKNSISEGTFEFNSKRIAVKLINFEKELF